VRSGRACVFSVLEPGKIAVYYQENQAILDSAVLGIAR
jgi:hypothetical protein